jgi:hypothetical protein
MNADSAEESIAKRLAEEAEKPSSHENRKHWFARAAEHAYKALRRTSINHRFVRIQRAFLVIEYYEKAEMWTEAIAKIDEFLAFKSFDNSTRLMLQYKRDLFTEKVGGKKP